MWIHNTYNEYLKYIMTVYQMKLYEIERKGHYNDFDNLPKIISEDVWNKVKKNIEIYKKTQVPLVGGGFSS